MSEKKEKKEENGSRTVILKTPDEIRKEFTERPFFPAPANGKQTVALFD